MNALTLPREVYYGIGLFVIKGSRRLRGEAKKLVETATGPIACGAAFVPYRLWSD